MASEQIPVAQWDRGSAMAAVRSVNIDTAVFEVGNLASLADAETTLVKLKNIETRSDWPLPAREAAIHQFTRSLAELPRDAVAVEIMQHLHNYQAQTLVPHEDHGDALIPLFNIRGAAAGVENSWQRAEFGAEAGALLETDPRSLVSVYAQSTNHNQASAYRDALRQADLNDVVVVQETVLESIEEKSKLTSLLGVTTLRTANTIAVQMLLKNGRGAAVSPALVQLGERLQRPDIASLLEFAIEQAPASNATLAIAAWWPRLKRFQNNRISKPSSIYRKLPKVTQTLHNARKWHWISTGAGRRTHDPVGHFNAGSNPAFQRTAGRTGINRMGGKQNSRRT
jgi:hypothetical protein